MTRESVGVGLMGLGTVAGQVARVLLDRSKMLAERAGCPIELRKIKIIPADLERPLARELPAGLLTTSEDEFFAEAGIDIVVEAIGGEYPALEYHRRAMSGGRHVVTSNKEVVAKNWAELMALAQQHNVQLRYEASVGGGIPLIAPFQDDLAANEIRTIYAIINGTTNFILTKMTREGTDFAAALKQAQKLGYAEANPANDIEGIDSTYKLAILASLAFQTHVRPDDIHHEGISRLASRDFRYARELGLAIKLLAIGKQAGKAIEARVHPVLIPEDTFLAKVDGVYNAVMVEGDLVGKVLFFGEGAGALPTSSAVVADIVALARDTALGVTGWPRPRLDADKKVRPMSEIETRYYLRMTVADRPGVLARIATAFGDHHISISSVIQQETDRTAGTAEIVIMTHPAQEKAVQAALDELARLDEVGEISNFIRVEDV
ncbi:MAG: homoserine dehydrogenase [Chloroflexi bacterium]|nr:homoserine dehydrogenase [Chloroflexota bacterium]